jgi:CRP-like cAMP-binding protein
MKTPELFEDLPAFVYKEILSAASPRNFASREVLFWEGDPIRKIFLLTEGWVKLTQLNKVGIETVLRLHLPGDIAGPLGLGPEDTYTSTAHALHACKTLVWGAADFTAILERFPAVHHKARYILARQTYELSCRICEISTGNVQSRLAHGLLYLLSHIGRKVNGHFELGITQEVLGQMTSTAFFTVNRQLSEWEQLGLIRCRRNAIIIRDSSSLQDFCNFRQFTVPTDANRN